MELIPGMRGENEILKEQSPVEWYFVTKEAADNSSHCGEETGEQWERGKDCRKGNRIKMRRTWTEGFASN